MAEEHRTALITGASSGIGSVFARQLAARGYDLILVARRRERLDALAQELQRQHGVTAEVLVADLARSEDVERVAGRIESHPALETLVNNAGFGSRHHFVELDLNYQLDMIRVHVLASVRLTRAALPGMIERRGGAVINVSSMSGFLPMPRIVIYSATKAFLITFSEALAKELRNTGVRVQALCPGFTYTEFHDAAEFEGFDRSETSKALWMSAEDVVSESLSALDRNRTICIPGRKNRLLLRVAQSALGKVLMRALAGKRWE
jgi:short-subunit dehydrogenase